MPDVSGMPVQLYESDRLIRRGYTRAGQIALAFVIFYLILHFRGLFAAAIANAVFDAVGVRVRDLPVTAERVRRALAASAPAASGAGSR